MRERERERKRERERERERERREKEEGRKMKKRGHNGLLHTLKKIILLPVCKNSDLRFMNPFYRTLYVY